VVVPSIRLEGTKEQNSQNSFCRPEGGRMGGCRKPALQQRSAARNDEEGEADLHRQQIEKKKGRIGMAGGQGVFPQRRRQGDQGQQHEQQVQSGLAVEAEFFHRQVSVAVAAEQGGLEKDHAGVPDRRRAAIEGQQHLARHRLDGKEQKGAQKKGGSITDQHFRRYLSGVDGQVSVQYSRPMFRSRHPGLRLRLAQPFVSPVLLIKNVGNDIL
jgi:hypothetical protein